MVHEGEAEAQREWFSATAAAAVHYVVLFKRYDLMWIFGLIRKADKRKNMRHNSESTKEKMQCLGCATGACHAVMCSAGGREGLGHPDSQIVQWPTTPSVCLASQGLQAQVTVTLLLEVSPSMR